MASHSGPFLLHLISKRIKDFLTQKHQYNAKYLSQLNDKNAFRKLKKLSICIYIKMEEAKQELQESYDQEKYVKDSCNY